MKYPISVSLLRLIVSGCPVPPGAVGSDVCCATYNMFMVTNLNDNLYDYLQNYPVLVIRAHKRCNYYCTSTCNGVPFASVPKSQAYNLLLSDMSLLKTTLIVAFAIFTMSGLVS